MDRESIRRMRRWTVLAGPAGAVVAFGAILLATGTASWFSWTGNALSDLGRPDRASAVVFNGGLVLAGILGVVFLGGQWHRRSNRIATLGCVILLASFGCLALIGIYPLGHPAHTPVSVAFFVGLTYGLFVLGSGDVLAGWTRRGLGTIWLGIAHATAWILWVALGTDGIAIPETVGALVAVVWVLGVAWQSWPR